MPKTLLVVDDSATMRKVFEMTFAGEDVTVVTHDGGDSLLARARDARPALAIVDVALGGVSGYDVARALKGDATLGGLPVMMLYSEHSPLDEARARDAGAEDSLLKPFDTQNAIEKVRRFLGQTAAAPGGRLVEATPPVGPAYRAPAPVAPAGPAARSPASAGVGSVGGQPPVATRPKATQVFGPSSAGSPPAPPTARSTYGGQGGAVPPPRPPAAPPPPPSSHVQSADIEIEVDGGEEEITLEPSVPMGPSTRLATTIGMAPVGSPSVGQPPRAAPAPPPAAAPSPATTAAAAAPAAAISADVSQRIAALGLTPAQADAVASLTREVVERVVWEVVPQLAETLIREEIRRLTAE